MTEVNKQKDVRVICTRCFKPFNPRFGAISRADNITKICETCGIEEAFLETTLLFGLDFKNDMENALLESERRTVHINKTIVEKTTVGSLKYKHYEKIIKVLDELRKF